MAPHIAIIGAGMGGLTLAAALAQRTARIQGASQQNTFMRQPTNTDWVYGYDAWNAPLPEYA